MKCPKNKICIKQPGNSMIDFTTTPESKICKKCNEKSKDKTCNHKYELDGGACTHCGKIGGLKDYKEIR